MIKTVSLVESIRKRPGMYIGSVAHGGIKNLLTDLFKSLLLDDKSTWIRLELLDTLSFRLSWQTTDTSLLSVEDIITYHWDQPNVRHSHFCVLCALSKRFEIRQVQPAGKLSYVFQEGIFKQQDSLSNTSDAYHTIQASLDLSIFDSIRLDYYLLLETIQELSFHFPTATIQFSDLRPDFQLHNQFHFPQGWRTYLERWQRQDLSLQDKGATFHLQHDTIQAELTWYVGHYHRHLSFVNYHCTRQDGTHVDGVLAGAVAALEQVQVKPYSTWSRIKSSTEEFLKEFNFILAVHLPAPAFRGSTKGELANKEIQPLLKEWIKKELIHYIQSV